MLLSNRGTWGQSCGRRGGHALLPRLRRSWPSCPGRGPIARVTVASWDLVRSALAALSWSSVLAGSKALVRWLSVHTGVPALLVAAVLLCVGYRLLKRSARFALEVAAVALALVAASELGWIRW